MIIRRKHTKNFAIMSQEIFRDTRLSPEALGILCYLRSLPDDWTVSQDHLRTRFGTGKHKMQGIVRELIETGWMVRQTARKAGRGTFAGSDYIVNDEPSASVVEASPQPENRATVEPPVTAAAPQLDLPAPDDPEPEEPAPENRAAYQVLNPTKDSSPLNPPTGGGLKARKLLRGNGVSAPVAPQPAANQTPPAALEGEAVERFARLEAAYPASARSVTRRDQAQAIFAGMSAEDQILAIGAAASYAADLGRTGYAAKGLHGWLRQRRFANFRPSAPIGAASTAPARVFVEQGSPEWEAWMAYRRAQGEVGSCPTTEKAGHRNPGWHFPSALPPAGVARAA
nr:helix-turn-helix domain-containing protein [Methylobacterium sp. L1A1]